MKSEEVVLMTGKSQKPLQKLNKIAKIFPMDIEFQDITYKVRDARQKGGWRQLLKSVNGKFRSGELTAILGPSGAGKSTLLNILAGYVSAGVTGSVKVNDRPREMKIFNKLSSYIVQENLVQPCLTLREAMIFAASLKLGGHITQEEKNEVVEEVISLLGLESCYDVRSEYLSGGQRKRLAVALELVNNPPVIFLDEPTSGLDNYAIKQCMDLLHKISKIGRTVICTIHQPPASLFNTFDQVYMVADGYCIYNGTPEQLVPFLSLAGCPCPQFSTPAEYIIELVHSSSDSIKTLSNVIQNGKINMKEIAGADQEVVSSSTSSLGDNNIEVYRETTTQQTIEKCDIMYPNSFWRQFVLIMGRMFLQLSRNKSILYIQFFHHLLSGFLIGGVFFGMGNNGALTVSLFKYCVSCNVFFMYTYVMSPVLLFPLEVKLMQREYFNRWYSLKAYFCALTVATAPMLIVFGTMFSTIVYFMTGQPLEVDRFLGFSIMGLAVGLCSQGLGYAIGSLFSITLGSIVGPSFLMPLLAVATYGMGYKSTIEPLMKVIIAMDYLRFGVVGFCNSLFYERAPLDCPEEEIYCHYSRPDVLLEDTGITVTYYTNQLVIVLVYMVVFRTLAYVILKLKLNSELSNKIVYIASKVIRQT